MLVLWGPFKSWSWFYQPDTNQLMGIILNERKIELCFEGKRFFDLKRVGRLKEFLGPLGWKDHMVSYPIPQEEIDLTQMEQNPGY